MDNEEITVAPRFDAAEHVSYDEADLASIDALSSTLLRPVVEDAADNALLLARQLDYVKARTYDKKYPQMKGALLVPTTSDAPEWAETITYRMYDSVGIAKIIANYADDLPRADVRGREVTVRVRDIGDSYGYNINELRASRALGAGLDTRKAAAARLAIEQKINRITLMGDADYNLLGFLNHPNIGEATGLTGDWNDAGTTGDDILDDLNIMWTSFILQGFGVHTPNFLALPPAAHAAAFSKRLTDSQETAGSFWQRMHPGVRIEPVYECVGADEGEDVALLYERNEENFSSELVMAFNQQPPQARNLEFVVPCLARHAGVQVRYPLAFLRAVGI